STPTAWRDHRHSWRSGRPNGNEAVAINEAQTVESVEVEVDALVAQVECFLREHLPADWVAAIDHEDPEALSAARDQLDLTQWWVDLADAGYVTPTWPKEYGGLGVSARTGGSVARKLGGYKGLRFSNPCGEVIAGQAFCR